MDTNRFLFEELHTSKHVEAWKRTKTVRSSRYTTLHIIVNMTAGTQMYMHVTCSLHETVHAVWHEAIGRGHVAVAAGIHLSDKP